jgi:hypothetical protein
MVCPETESDSPASDSQGSPGSDDFCTYVTASQPPIVGSQQQIATDAGIRDAHLHAIAFCFTPPPELRQLSAVAIRILGPLARSASVERVFSVA